MPPYQHTERFLSALCVIALLTQPLPAMARRVAAESDLASMKETFTEAWQVATETTKKRGEIEQYLVSFDATVAKAKKDIALADAQRKELSHVLQEQEKLIETVRQQRASVATLRQQYLALASGVDHRAAIFVAHLVRVSDNESRDAVDLVQGAMERARALARDAEDADKRLAVVAASLDAGMRALKQRERLLASAVVEKTAFIDASWKQKKLSEQELKEVALEAQESSNRAASLQSSLLRINEQLKDRTRTLLTDALHALQDEATALESKKQALETKDQALRASEENVLRLYQQTLTQRNTDTKQYRRVQERELELARLQQTLVLGMTVSDDRSGNERPLTDEERQLIGVREQFLMSQLALMRSGVPDDVAAAYLTAKADSDRVSVARAEIAADIATIKADQVRLLKNISEKAGQRDATEQQFALADLPPLFVWPVQGPITAGFYDPEYKAVFGVPHRAIDIAVPFASPVHAISDGVVYAVRDGGRTGYSYVLLGHRNGYASLYGHVSSFLVRQGDVVSAGQTIALSGGTPGTHGAGHMTTGAHVHLEIMKDGVHVNPLSVLRQ